VDVTGLLAHRVGNLGAAPHTIRLLLNIEQIVLGPDALNHLARISHPIL
jgi:hypothetical protein